MEDHLPEEQDVEVEDEEYLIPIESIQSTSQQDSEVKTSRKRPHPSSPESAYSVFNPDAYGEVLPEDVPRPVCDFCSLAFLTWASYEYHILRYHVMYRPYRCAGCKHLAFHTEAEGRHHATCYHDPAPNGFPIMKITDFEKESEYMECMMNAKTTDDTEGISFSRERLNEGLKMIEKVQLVKFRAQRAQLPRCIRHDVDLISTATEPETIEEEPAPEFEPEPVFFEEHQNVEFQEYRQADVLDEL
ncbi:hypothetical protein B9Z55_018342 [Caenorhabditis nigoni]|uniref:C2H2-type domain-containing protein n=1 Tax=Caenorhabditis nigoni TaxID=1611254 RepID=A0A2G5TDN8_9PELO|nr:hypothetical protein B9Z55_018342 [Caenorhabditis nigoni]